MIIFRYLTKEVYATTLATTIVLLLILISNQLIHYLNQAAVGGLPAAAIMQLMSLQIPLLLGYLLPLSLFLAILLTYGRLYTDNEMTILTACGFSRWQILKVTLGFSCFIMLAVSWLSLWVQPKLATYRDRIYAQAAVATPLATLYPGRFQSWQGGKWVMYVKSASHDRTTLEDVFVAHTSTPTVLNPLVPLAPQNWTLVSAESGEQVTDKKTGDQFLVLKNGYRYQGVPGEKSFEIVKYDQYGVRIQEAATHLEKQAETLPTTKLWQIRKTNKMAAVELQWRFSMPLATLLLACAAVPLSRVQPRSGRFAKIFPAMLLYVTYVDLIFIAQAAMQKGTLAVFPGIWWVHGGMLLITAALVWHYLTRSQGA